MWRVRRPAVRFLHVGFALLAGCSSDGLPAAPDPGGPPTQSTLDPGVVLNEDLTAQQLFPATNWWNRDVTVAPVGCALPGAHRLDQRPHAVQPRRDAEAAPRLRPASVRHPLRGCGGHAAAPSRDLRPLSRRERPGGTQQASWLSDPHGSTHASQLHRGRRAGRRHVGGPPPADRGPRPRAPVRAVGDALERRPVALGGRIGSRFQLGLQCAAARGLDFRRRRRPRNPPRPRACRRGLRSRRDSACVSVHDPRHQRPRVARIALGRFRPECAADGDAATNEGQYRHQRLRARSCRRSSAP